MTLGGTNTYVVGEGPAYVIDPGPADEAHLEAVRSAAAQRGGIEGVLLTHSHADHSEGTKALGAPLVWGGVSEHDETTPAQLAKLPVGRSDVPSPGPGPFEVVPTPGHAADHVCLRLGDVVFCGDLVLGEGSTIVPPRAHGGSLAAYMRSLERLRELRAGLLCPGHGPWITRPDEKVAEYLAHRREREAKLISALERGERSRVRLLDEAWDDVPAALRPAAAVAMEAHLEKLEAEGRLPEGLEP